MFEAEVLCVALCFQRVVQRLFGVSEARQFRGGMRRAFFAPLGAVREQGCFIHEKAFQVRQVAAGAAQDGEAVRIEVAPVVAARGVQPGQRGEGVHGVAQPHDDEAVRERLEGEAGLQVFDDVHVARRDGQRRQLLNGRGQIAETADAGAQCGVEQAQTQGRRGRAQAAARVEVAVFAVAVNGGEQGRDERLAAFQPFAGEAGKRDLSRVVVALRVGDKPGEQRAEDVVVGIRPVGKRVVMFAERDGECRPAGAKRVVTALSALPAGIFAEKTSDGGGIGQGESFRQALRAERAPAPFAPGDFAAA